MTPYNYGYDFRPPDPEAARQAEIRLSAKRKLRRLGNIFGAAVIAVTLLTELVSGALAGVTWFMRGAGDSFDYRSFTQLWNSPDVQNIINIFYSAVVIGGTFLVIYLLNKSDPSSRIPFGKPAPAKVVPFVILGALGACTAANLVTGYIDYYIFNAQGTDIYNSVMPETPDTALGIVLYFIAVAILPPMIEEFALRGVVMQPLRRFGDAFAIVVSALLFAALHSTPIQLIFAFAAGLFIGYATVVTGSIWTGIIIHCLNNSISVAGSIVIDKYGETAAESLAFNAIYYAVIGIGAVAITFWFLKKDRVRLKTSPLTAPAQKSYAPTFYYDPPLTKGSLYRVFFSSPGMIIAYFCIVWRLLETFASLKIMSGMS